MGFQHRERGGPQSAAERTDHDEGGGVFDEFGISGFLFQKKTHPRQAFVIPTLIFSLTIKHGRKYVARI
jgi:hypothetical protein